MIEMMLFVLKISKIRLTALETYWRHANWISQKNIAIKLFSVQITFGINNLTSYLNVESSIIIIERISLFGSGVLERHFRIPSVDIPGHGKTRFGPGSHSRLEMMMKFNLVFPDLMVYCISETVSVNDKINDFIVL